MQSQSSFESQSSFHKEARAIGPKSYNEIAQMVPSKVEKNRALKRFIESSKDGLTALGLRSLKEVIEEANGAVLFINNQYSYVVKVRGDLLLLVSDEEQAKKTPDAQWKVLGEVSEKGKLLDSEFKEIKQLTIGPNVEESALKMQRMLIEDEARQKMKQSRPPKKSRTRNKGKINVPRPESVVASDDTEELEGSISNEERNQELDMEETEEEKDDHMSETFGDFLRKFTEQGTSAPFFEGQVKALDHCKSYTLTIKFKDLESYDKENARYVCDNMPRILDRLNQCACKFLLEHDEFNTKPDEVSKNTKIEITDLPAPNSVQPFSKFALEHAMHKIWELSDYGAKKVSSTTFIGRKAAHGYLNCILRKHKSGLCWNGSFSLEDFVVLDHNGVLEFVIVKQAYEEYSQERAISDFNTFCVILFWYFEADEADEKHPPYFHQFQLDYLINMPKREDTQVYDRWDRYMADHFAFKAPQAISTLITETYEVCDSKRIGPDYGLLNLIGDLDPWVTNVKKSGSISLMDTFKFGPAIAGTTRYDVLNYWRMLVFGRHFTRHMLRAKRDENVFIQVQDLLIVHLMLGFVLKGQLARVIRFIMQENGFSDGLFSSAWRHFQASETFDEEPKQPDMLPGGGANTSNSQVVAS